MEILLPRDHFVHLKELASARRESLEDTVYFLLGREDRNEENWLLGRYPGDPTEEHKVVIKQDQQPDTSHSSLSQLDQIQNGQTDEREIQLLSNG